MSKNSKVWLPNCTEFTDRDQIAVEREVERQMEEAYETKQLLRFDHHLDPNPKCPWRLHVLNEAGEVLRLNITVPGYTPKDKVEYMLLSGRFDKYVPEDMYETEEWRFWIEKW